MSATQTPESDPTVLAHGDSVEGPGARDEVFAFLPPRRPAQFPLEMPDLPIDGPGLAIARALRESA